MALVGCCAQWRHGICSGRINPVGSAPVSRMLWTESRVIGVSKTPCAGVGWGEVVVFGYSTN